MASQANTAVMTEKAADELTVPEIYNIAKMYAALVAEGSLRITILKPVDFGNVSAKLSVFLKTLLSTLLTTLRKKAHKAGYEKAAKDCTSFHRSVPEASILGNESAPSYAVAPSPSTSTSTRKPECPVPICHIV